MKNIRWGAIIVIGVLLLALAVRHFMGGDERFIEDTTYWGPMTWLGIGALVLIALIFYYFIRRDW